MPSDSKHAPDSTLDDRGFFLRPFLKYLKPHKWRLIIALVSMVGVGFFGSFSLLLLRTPLEILFTPRKETRQERLEHVLHQNYDVLSQALQSQNANPEALRALQTLDEELKKDASEDEKNSPDKKKWLNNIPGYTRLKAWSDVNLKPHQERLKAKQVEFENWIRRENHKALWLFAGILVFFTLLKGVAEYVARYHLAHTLYHVMVSVKEDIFRHVINLDYGFFIKRTTGFLESRVTSDVERIRAILDNVISDGFQQPVMLFFYLIVLFIISPQLTWIALIGIVFAFGPLYYFARKIKKVTRRSKRKQDELNSTMEESLRNFRVVKIFGGENYEVQKFRALNQRLFKLFIQRRIARFAASPIMEVIGSFAAATVLIVGGVLVLGSVDQKPILDPPSFVVYLVLCTRFYGPLKKLSKMNVNWSEARISAARIQEMLTTEPEVVESPNPKPIERLQSAVDLQNVTFCYGDAEILQNINFRLDRGRVVALVGKSGSGKTTLANLLPRLFDPTSGRILFDGTDARDLKIADLRRLFGVVTQDTVLFNDTVAANIAYGETQIDRERVIQCAKAAFAHDFIQKLDGGLGYETIVGQAGQSLSGGQRQRLAIARALYRDPQILILDEATSSLDVESERFVQNAIDNLLQGRTALIIAHRLSTIRRADEIFVLDQGRIVERGDHENLLEAKGEYFKLYEMALEPAAEA